MSWGLAPRLRDRVAVAAFLLLLWLPMMARSSCHPAPLPGTPQLLAKLHAIACLFTHKPEGWSSYDVQVRYPGRVQWDSLDESDYFRLQPFGRRTRLHRLFVAWQAEPSTKTKHLARWLLARHEQLHPEGPQPEAIRFARAWMIPSADAPPQHGWRHPSWLEVPPRNRRVFVTYTADELRTNEGLD